MYTVILFTNQWARFVIWRLWVVPAVWDTLLLISTHHTLFIAAYKSAMGRIQSMYVCLCLDTLCLGHFLAVGQDTSRARGKGGGLHEEARRQTMIKGKEKKNRRAPSWKTGTHPEKTDTWLAELRSEMINNKSNLPGIHPVQICPGEG